MKKILFSTVLAASSWVAFAQDTTNRTNDSSYHQQSTMNMTNQTNMNTNANPNNATTSSQTYNNTTTSNYSAYGIPTYVQTNFQTQHPNVSNLTWDRPTADWYHGYYSDANGRYTHVYYSTDPYYNSKYYPERVTGYTVSLPVLQTYVPDAVISTATNLYKQNLYDITGMKGNNSQNIYEVRVVDNGEMKSMWMDSIGTAVTDYYRTEEQMNMNNTTTNPSNMNSSGSTDTNATMNNDTTNSTGTNDTNTNNNVKTKTKTIMNDGSQMKTKTKNGKTTTKKSGAM